MIKFGRDYVLTVGIGPYGPPDANSGPMPIASATNSVVIKPPFTLEFDVRRELMASSQTGSFKIKNLSGNTRDSIYKDQYAFALYAKISLQAGYRGQSLPTIFDGTIRWAQSRRENRKDIVTEIECFDGGFPIGNSFSARLVPAGYSYVQAFKDLNSDLVNVSATPIIGNVPPSLGSRPTVLLGPTWEMIQKILPPTFSATIDNNQLKILSPFDAIQYGASDSTFTISSATGLLDPPIREGNGVSCRMMFEPRITIGQQVNLVSIDNSNLNATYQVSGIYHQGIISPSEGGAAFTTLLLYNFGKISALTGYSFAPSP